MMSLTTVHSELVRRSPHLNTSRAPSGEILVHLPGRYSLCLGYHPDGTQFLIGMFHRDEPLDFLEVGNRYTAAIAATVYLAEAGSTVGADAYEAAWEGYPSPSADEVVRQLFPDLQPDAADALGTLLFYFTQDGQPADEVARWLTARYAEVVR